MSKQGWDHRYRLLSDGETIQEGDEYLTDTNAGWKVTKHAIGQPAPSSYYTSHRIYRRRITPAGRAALEQSNEA